MSAVLVDRRGHFLELWLQLCGNECGLGLWVAVLDRCHLTVNGLVGPFNFSVDLWAPWTGVAGEDAA